MAILDDLVVDVAYIRDLCYGNSVTVLEVLRELHELQLRHCLISVPQSEEEIGEAPSSLYLRKTINTCKRKSHSQLSRQTLADEEDSTEARTQLTSASGHDCGIDNSDEASCCSSPPTNEEVCCRFRIFDMKDVLHRLNEELNKSEQLEISPTADTTTTEGGKKESADYPLQSVRTVLGSLAWQVANCSGRNDYKPVWANSTLKEIISSFQDYSRVPIFEWNSEKNLLRFRMIFSATDFFKMLCRYFITTGSPSSALRRKNSSSVTHSSSATDELESGNRIATTTSEVVSTRPAAAAAAAVVNDSRSGGASTPDMIRELICKIDTIKLQDSVWFKTNGKKTPLCMSEHVSIRTMIRFIAETGYSAIPLLTDDQCPIGLISTSDFRLMMLDLASGMAGGTLGDKNTFADEFQAAQNLHSEAGARVTIISDPFQKPIISYLSRVKRVECLKTRYPIISSKVDATIMQVVQKLAKAQIHRIIIMSDSCEAREPPSAKVPNGSELATSHNAPPGRKAIAGLFSRTDFGKVLAAILVDIDAVDTSQHKKDH